jgi:hypothetical protein
MGYNTSTGSQISGQAIFTANANDYVALANNTIYQLVLQSDSATVGNNATGESGAFVNTVTSASINIAAGSTIFVFVQSSSGTNLSGYTVTDTAGNTYAPASLITTSFASPFYQQTRIYSTTNVIKNNQTLTASATVTGAGTTNTVGMTIEVVDILGGPYTIVEGPVTSGSSTTFSMSVVATQPSGIVLESVVYTASGITANSPASVIVNVNNSSSGFIQGAAIGSPLSSGTNTITVNQNAPFGNYAATIIAVQSLPFINAPTNASLDIFQLK